MIKLFFAIFAKSTFFICEFRKSNKSQLVFFVIITTLKNHHLLIYGLPQLLKIFAQASVFKGFDLTVALCHKFLKTKKMKTINLLKIVGIVLLTALTSNSLLAQDKIKLGVVSMDTKGLIIDNATMTNLVHLELEKANKYEVLDRYDVADMVKANGFNVNECFGKSCLVKVGEVLKADKMLSGSMEKFGNKIVFIFRLVDVKKEAIEKTDVVEFIDQQDEIQTMVRVGLNNIMEIENDKYIMDLLVNYDQPITSQRTTLRLNGPRVGVSYIGGTTGERLQASKAQGGYNMYPVSSLIGYQFEKQFLSSGDFQALFEFFPAVNGLESGVISPSLTTLIGFRLNKSGFEFGMGPVLRLTQTATGYFDNNGNWILEENMDESMIGNVELEEQFDRRGLYMPTAGMIFAVGKTIRSGYLNIPVNFYWNPKKEGSVFGLTVGFNVAQTPILRTN